MLTPSERLAIYEQMLAILKEDSSIYIGLCFILNTMIFKGPIEELPELMKYKPEDRFIHQCWWPWTKEGKARRMEVVEQAIKEVKTLIHEPHRRSL